jgi:signal transduction histidine kinase
VDRLVAAGFTLIQLLGPTTGATEPAHRAAWAGALGLPLALVQGVPLLWRRRQPVLVLAVSGAAYVCHALLVSPVPPYAGWAAVYAAVVYTRTRRAALAAVVAAAAVQAATLATLVARHDITGGDVPMPLLVTVVVVLTAFLVREQRAFRTAERQALAREAATEERLRIARELHDLVGHGLSTIAVQSSTGRVALDSGRVPEARQALAAVERASRGALREVRVLLGVLRDDGAGRPRAPLPGLRDVAALAAGVRSERLDVRVDIGGDLDGVPPAVRVTAYRVVQEALTNVVRHAGAREAVVHVDVGGDAVLVEVTDDGRGVEAADAAADDGHAGTGDHPGHGLVGMRERVEACGGDLTVGAQEDRSGWRVRARFPLRPEGAT